MKKIALIMTLFSTLSTVSAKDLDKKIDLAGVSLGQDVRVMEIKAPHLRCDSDEWCTYDIEHTDIKKKPRFKGYLVKQQTVIIEELKVRSVGISLASNSYDDLLKLFTLKYGEPIFCTQYTNLKPSCTWETKKSQLSISNLYSQGLGEWVGVRWTDLVWAASLRKQHSQ